MNGYVLDVEAETDLREIWGYIAQDSVNAADNWMDRLFEAFEMLARSPHIGHTRKELTTLPVLFWPVDSYLIIYRVAADTTQIVAVTQGSRNIPTFLKRRSGS